MYGAINESKACLIVTKDVRVKYSNKHHVLCTSTVLVQHNVQLPKLRPELNMEVYAILWLRTATPRHWSEEICIFADV